MDFKSFYCSLKRQKNGHSSSLLQLLKGCSLLALLDQTENYISLVLKQFYCYYSKLKNNLSVLFYYQHVYQQAT